MDSSSQTERDARVRRTTRGFGVSSLVPHEIVGKLAPAAGASGYAMFWVNDLPQASGIASLGVAAKAAPHIELGVGVLAVDRWDADRLAEAIAGAEIDPRRLTVGIGAGQLTAGSLEAVKTASANLGEIGVRRVVVGSLGPKMTRLGGVHADGVLLNWVTPSAAGTLAGAAVSGAADAGRETAGGETWLGAYTRVASDPAAGDRLRAECAAYESYPAYARHFARFGMSGMDTSVLGDQAHIARWLDSFDGIVDHMVVRAIAASDTIDAYLNVLRASAPVAAREDVR